MPSLHFYMQLVTPSDVPSAVRMLTKICTINFQVSLFIIFYFLLKLLISGTLIVVTTARSVVRRAA